MLYGFSILIVGLMLVLAITVIRSMLVSNGARILEAMAGGSPFAAVLTWQARVPVRITRRAVLPPMPLRAAA